MRLLVATIGWVLIAFGLLGAATTIDDAHKGKNDTLGVGIVMIALMTGGGGMLVRTSRRMKKRGALPPKDATHGPTVEQRILAAARSQGGHLTPVSAAAQGTLTIEQAREELERLAKENACLMEISADGLVVFRFPEFETPESKRLS